MPRLRGEKEAPVAKGKSQKRGPVRAERGPARPLGPADPPMCGCCRTGVCQLPDDLFTKTMAYEDINYAVASHRGSICHLQRLERVSQLF